MNKTEATEASTAIGLMLKGFPSSQSTITDDSARVYLFAVEDFSLEAVKRACRQFVRGEVRGRNNAFAPSAPELADLTRDLDRAITVERFQAAHVFIEEGSERWAQLLIHRGKTSLPSFDKDGRKGWYFTSEETDTAALIALPPPISTNRRIELQMHVRSKLGFSVGDADAENGDMGQIGAVA